MISRLTTLRSMRRACYNSDHSKQRAFCGFAMACSSQLTLLGRSSSKMGHPYLPKNWQDAILAQLAAQYNVHPSLITIQATPGSIQLLVTIATSNGTRCLGLQRFCRLNPSKRSDRFAVYQGQHH